MNIVETNDIAMIGKIRIQNISQLKKALKDGIDSDLSSIKDEKLEKIEFTDLDDCKIRVYKRDKDYLLSVKMNSTNDDGKVEMIKQFQSKSCKNLDIVYYAISSFYPKRVRKLWKNFDKTMNKGLK